MVGREQSLARLASAKRDADANFSKTKKPDDTEQKCPGPALTTGLGADIDREASKCREFADKLNNLQSNGWLYEYGTAGAGSYCDKRAQRIVIDSGYQGRTADTLTVLAHECGHAGYKPDPYVRPEGLTREQYARSNANRMLKDEGEATLTNIEIKRCLERNGGANIRVAGRQAETYEKVASKYPDPKDRDKARQEIADLFADGERPSTNPSVTYREYYEQEYLNFYDRNVKKG